MFYSVDIFCLFLYYDLMIAVALWYIVGVVAVVPCVMVVGLLFKPLLRYEFVNVMLALPGIALVSITAMTIPSILLLDVVTIVRGIFGATEGYEWEGIGLFTIGAVIAGADVLFFLTGFKSGKPAKKHESLTQDAIEFIGGAADTVTDAIDSGDGDTGDGGDGGGH